MFLIRLGDFKRDLTSFPLISCILINIVAYFLYMTVFVVFYCLPEEIHEASRSASMKPWKPVYEGEEDAQTQSQDPEQEGSNSNVDSHVSPESNV